MIKIEELYNKTNSGLDIIHLYYPDAEPGKFFRMRDERTPSASVKLINGTYKVTDFGNDATSLSPIDVAMQAEGGIPFYQCLCKLASVFKIDNYITKETNKPDIEYSATTEPDCPVTDIITSDTFTPDELKFWLPSMKEETLQKYGWSAVKSYCVIKNGKRIKISSNATFPMFIRNCGEFQKLYKPYDFNVRFLCVGNKPYNFVNGLQELTAAYNDYTKQQESIDEKTGEVTVKSDAKLPECVICSGERDAMTAALLGYFPIWFNSETATIPSDTIRQLGKMCERIYNIPDIDTTGKERGNIVALTYPEILTVTLPEWLSTYHDAKGKKRKDLRDYAELRDGKGLASDFKNLLISAKGCKFWEHRETEKGIKLSISSSYLLQYLKVSGFRKLRDGDTFNVVRMDGDIICKSSTIDIRDYIVSEVRRRHLGKDVEDRVLDDKKTSSTVAADLDTIIPDTVAYTSDSQTFRFKNFAVTVRANEVSVNKKASCQFFDSKVIQHNFRRMASSFSSDGKTLKINDKSSHVFRFLINASRLYWRKEFETGNDAADAEYKEQNHFTIDGSRLSASEIEEQTANLINKLYAIGFILHRYKDASNAMALWVMENKVTLDDVSSGGSGKSFIFKALAHLLNIASWNGRDAKLTDNTHILDRVTEETDLLLMQDFKGDTNSFNYFYTFITDNMNKNAKHKASEEIDFTVSPKIAFTSNFAPPIKTNDSSSIRRLLFMVYSDYYHAQTEDNGYKETRAISDDFGGRNIFDAKYSEEYYNQDFNFLLDCLQFYLQMRAKNIKCQAPLHNVYKRIRRQSMGDNFIDWADNYFAKDGEHLDCFVTIAEARNAFIEYSGLSKTTPQTFKNKLKDWCSQTDYVEQFNPPGYCTSDGKRIMRRMDGSPKECIYILSKKTEKAATEPENDNDGVPF